MKFAGRVWKEENEIRGKIDIIDDDASSRPCYFTNFEELKIILEKEFGKQNP